MNEERKIRLLQYFCEKLTRLIDQDKTEEEIINEAVDYIDKFKINLKPKLNDDKK